MSDRLLELLLLLNIPVTVIGGGGSGGSGSGGATDNTGQPIDYGYLASKVVKIVPQLGIDYRALGRSRVARQYQESPKFLAYLDALLSFCNELELVLQDVALQSDIDQADGVNLDVIGEIVGISRIVPDSVPVQFFGFDGQDGALPYGDEGYSGNGGRFREEAESATATTILSDQEYRLLIKAKIVKNHSNGTNEDLLQGLSYLFGQAGYSVPVSVDDLGGMAVQIAIGRPLTYLEKVLVANLDILPKPAGVRISQRVTYNASSFFGFSDQLGALPFGEEGSAISGGQFAEEF